MKPYWSYQAVWCHLGLSTSVEPETKVGKVTHFLAPSPMVMLAGGFILKLYFKKALLQIWLARSRATLLLELGWSNTECAWNGCFNGDCSLSSMIQLSPVPLSDCTLKQITTKLISNSSFTHSDLVVILPATVFSFPYHPHLALQILLYCLWAFLFALRSAALGSVRPRRRSCRLL